MKRSGIVSLLLAMVMLVTAFAVPLQAQAVNYSGLNTSQRYFLRVIGSLARADYYETDILASVTLSQAIYEGGWGAYSLPVGGKNIFGIKAYSTWQGKVYDQTSSMLYDSYSDFLISVGQSRANAISAWRAHDTWADSVRVHSDLLLTYDGVAGEKDPRTAYEKIVEGGYCNDNGYVDTAVSIVEQYGLVEYDDITPDSDGVVAITSSDDRVLLDIGETYTLSYKSYPSDKTPSSVVWKSDDTSVATVDQNGTITAVAHGMTLISATLANGREACCIVYVDCNATVVDKNVNVYTSPNSVATNNGKIYRGMAIKADTSATYSDVYGNTYYFVKGYNSKGELVSGYCITDYIYLNKRNVSKITVPKTSITVKLGSTYQVSASVAPADAVDKELTWSSNNSAVATVDANGVITGKSLGTTTVTAKAIGGTQRQITVTVAANERDYNGIISDESVRIRKTPSFSASSLGTVEIYTSVTVHGEAQGYWYKLTAVDNRGQTETGYILATYVRIIPDGYTVTYKTLETDTTLYVGASSRFEKAGDIAAGETVAIIDTYATDWNHIIGMDTDGYAVHGYAVLLDAPENPDTPDNPENPENPDNTDTPDNPENPNPDAGVQSYYGVIVASASTVRTGPSQSAAVLGKISKGSQISIIGEPISAEGFSWYKVSGTTTDGKNVTGYAASGSSSEDYYVFLYNAIVTGIDSDSYLNVRSQPSKSGSVVAKLSNSASVLVIGAANNGWYNIECVNSSGAAVTGYCSADYISLDGKVDAGLYYEPEKFSIVDEKISISDNILYGISVGTTVGELSKCFTGEFALLNSDGNALSDTSYFGTGDILRVTENGVAIDYKALVKGDVDGDGRISSTDYLMVKRAYFGTYELKGLYLQAALVSGRNTVVTSSDYLMIKRAYFGTYTIK